MKRLQTAANIMGSTKGHGESYCFICLDIMFVIVLLLIYHIDFMIVYSFAFSDVAPLMSNWKLCFNV